MIIRVVANAYSETHWFHPFDRYKNEKKKHKTPKVISVVGTHKNLTFAQGAAISTPYLTAYRALFTRSNARLGEPSSYMERVVEWAWLQSSLPVLAACMCWEQADS